MSYKYRYLQQNLGRSLAHFPVLLVTGPRRAGKSTLARHLLEQLGGTQYYSFDTAEEQARVRQDPQLFLQNLRTPAVLDEVQNIPELFPYLKAYVDQHQDSNQLKIILTGSQSFSMMTNVAESLAGRILIKNLLPFCTAEASSIDAAEIQSNFEALLDNRELNPLETLQIGSTVESAILKGGYPTVWEIIDSRTRDSWFSSYTQTYLERDVRSLVNVADLAKFQTFINLVAHRSGKLINYSELGKDISVSYKTSKSYLSVLKASFIWQDLNAYSRNIEERLIKSAKGIMLDSGLCCFLNGIADQTALSRSASYDAIYEAWVISEIQKLLYAFAPQAKLFHYRRTQTFEVDLLVEISGKILPIEIKNSAALRKDWTKGIKDFAEKAGSDYIGYGYVISRHNKEQIITQGIRNIPIQSITGVQ